MEMSKESGIGREFHFGSLLRFAFPTMLMMVFTSLYVIVDGIFVSRFVGSNALAAINIVAPVYALFMAIALMFSSGGSAIIAKKMGLGDVDGARRDFTLIIIATVVVCVVCTVIILIFLKPIVSALGASDVLYPYCRDYIIIILLFVPTFGLQTVFQGLFITNGTPVLGMVLIVLAGVVNMVFDYIFIVPFDMGIAGAAWATALGTLIPAVYGLIYFATRRGTLWFTKPKKDWRMLGHSCVNGASEMVSNMAYGVITVLYNLSMMRLVGEDGVAAITIIQYAEFLMGSLFFGFAMGVAPVFSYNYGSGNRPQTKRIFKICLIAVGSSSLLIFAIAQIFGNGVVGIFVPKGTGVYELASEGFRIFSFCFLFTGANIFASSLFTALSNGKLSAIISFLRTCVFICGAILILPHFIGVTGVWLAVPGAELITFILSLVLILRHKKEYGYL